MKRMDHQLSLKLIRNQCASMYFTPYNVMRICMLIFSQIRQFYMRASGIHRDLFQSVYNQCIGTPIKSSSLCDHDTKR